MTRAPALVGGRRPSTAAMVERHAIALAVAAFLLNYTLLSPWYVEDAAISFAFARHAAMGEGLVAYPGGAPVEGFSNPTWTLMLAALATLGISPWIAAKLLGAGFGVASLLLAVEWVRRIRPAAGPLVALAPAILALSPQFVVWCAAGLENPLFNVLLAAGAVAMLREMDADARRIPWSALWWSLLAFTRPEGPMYAAIAGTVGGVTLLARRGWGDAFAWAARWLALFLLPLLAWHTWRYATFAWELPNTYYAKLAEEERFQPFEWGRRGWRYLRNFAFDTGHGFLLPLYALGATGIGGRRGVAGLIAVVVVGLLLLPGLQWPSSLPFWPSFEEPDALVGARIVALAAAGGLLPLIGLGRRGQVGRVLAWYLALVAVFFALYSGGDWMAAYRWLGMAIVPMAVLLTDAVLEVRDAVVASAPPRSRVARLVVPVLAATPLVLGVIGSAVFLGGAETSPYDVYRRVKYMRGVQDRLHLDEVTLLEVDMGAHMWWSGFDLVDMAGLVDVPMGHHSWEKPFVEEYVFEERKPEFAHVHGSWAKRTKMTTHAEWRGYLEIPGYPISPTKTHDGNHIRRDLLVRDVPRPRPPPLARFGKQVELAAWEVPATTVAPGGSLYVELAWRRGPRGGMRPFRAHLVLASDEQLVVRELPPGYDWYSPSKWKRTEEVIGRHSVTLPDDLPPGTYDLGLVVLDADGVVPASTVPPGATTDAPRLAEGEVRWVDAITVQPEPEVRALADAGLAEVVLLAAGGNCNAAEDRWAVVRRHLGRSHPWQETARATIGTALGRCWAARATRAEGPGAVDAIEAARRWDHRDDEVVTAGRALADQLEAQGEEALAAGDLEATYDAWSGALTADPSRAWLRRRTEAVRDQRLGLTGN